MENIPVTTYRGFSAVSGETTFTQDMADIKRQACQVNHQNPPASWRRERWRKPTTSRSSFPSGPSRPTTGKEGSHRASPATTPSSRSTSTTWKKDSWSRPGPSSTKTRTPWAVSSPQKARLQAVRLHADGIHPASV